MALGRRIVLLIVLAAALAASCYVGGTRARVEQSNRAVELVVDYDEVEQIAASSGKSTVEVLSRFKDAGVTGVAVSEITFGDAIDAGLLIPFGPRLYGVEPYLGSSVFQQLMMALPNLWSRQVTDMPSRIGAPKLLSKSKLALPRNLPLNYIKQVPVGIPEYAVQAIRQAGLEVVARPINYPGATPEAIDEKLEWLRRCGITKVIFQGDQVLGFRGAVKNTAQFMKRHGICYGRVEFSKQKGDLDIARKIPQLTLMVHSIPQNEMPTLDEPTIVERFRKAVREREVRFCYVRLFAIASADMLNANAEYISAIAKSIENAGYEMKAAHPLAKVSVPRLVRIVVGVGVGAGVVLLIFALIDVSVLGAVLWTVLALALCAGLSLLGSLGLKIDAFIAALVFPTMAGVLAVQGAPAKPTRNPMALAQAIVRLVAAVAVVAAGGLLIVGLLSDRAFMLRIDQFFGVKIAHIFPVLALAVLFAGGVIWQRNTWREQKLVFAENVAETARNSVLWWQAVGLIAVIVIVAIMVFRSGNEGIEVSSFELKLRSILDRVLFVRPRTKEFLLGYPALLLGLVFAIRGLRRWAAPLVVLGSIGLVSALNTFCHIHTPLVVSGMRLANGLVTGLLVGLVGYLILRHLPEGQAGKPTG